MTALNLGYDYPINENFKISGGYLIAKFGFEIDENVPQGGSNHHIEIPTNFKIKAGGKILYVDAVYTF